MGATTVDSLSSIAVMDPKLGVPLLLAIMFYSNIFTSNDIICHDMLVSQLEKSILDFKKMNLELFFFETSPTSMTSIADKAIPRAVENIALAIGALCVLHGMIGIGIQTDSVTCRIVFQGYAKEGKLLSALNMVEELHRFGIKIPKNLYDYLLVALCKEGRPFAAQCFLIRMSQDGFVPQIST
ncbi:pentatricopeptide repeat-containing protein [Trifolium repens]|nr:pentatricopeptide repeat-containing protein [Trifolium repens]